MARTKHTKHALLADAQRTAARATPRPATKRGSVLVAVLAIVMLLTLMVTRFMNEAMEELEYRAIFNEPAEVRSFAYSMLEVAMANVQEIALIDEGKLYAAEQGWSDPLQYAGIQVPHNWQVSIEIRDESGKLPINTMSEAQLNRLLEEQLQFDFGTARKLSSTLLDWIDADDARRLNGAESDDYLDRNPAYRAANGPLQSLEELRLLSIWEEAFFEADGTAKPLFDQLADLVSVQNAGAINLNAAPAAVLELLALEDGWQDTYLFDGLQQPYLKQAPAAADSATSGVEVGLLRITVRLQRGNVPFMVSVLVQTAISSEPPTTPADRVAPATASNEAPKVGTVEEQQALQLPFKILQVSEYSQGDRLAEPARYSTMDIGKESASF